MWQHFPGGELFRQPPPCAKAEVAIASESTRATPPMIVSKGLKGIRFGIPKTYSCRRGHVNTHQESRPGSKEPDALYSLAANRQAGRAKLTWVTCLKDRRRRARRVNWRLGSRWCLGSFGSDRAHSRCWCSRLQKPARRSWRIVWSLTSPCRSRRRACRSGE